MYLYRAKDVLLLCLTITKRKESHISPHCQMIFFLWCYHVIVSEKENKISEIIRQDPIDTKDIERLSQNSSRYLIPHNQGMCRRYAIILYSIKERPGAVEEAEDMRQALEVARFQVIMYEWCNTEEVILQSPCNLVCRLLLEKKKSIYNYSIRNDNSLARFSLCWMLHTTTTETVKTLRTKCCENHCNLNLKM